MKKFLLILMSFIFAMFLFSCNECDHNWIDANCTEAKHCSRCDKSIGEPLGHTYGEWSVTKEATCTLTGEKTRTCICGATDVEQTPNSHELETKNAMPSTCTVQGYSVYQACKNCEYNNKALLPLDPNNHELENKPGVASTCSVQGYGDYKACKNCEYNNKALLPLDPNNHELEDKPGVASTCSVQGYGDYKACKNCAYNNKALLPLDADNHDIEHHTAQSPSCTSIGWYAYDTCTRCNYSTYEEIEMKEHDYTATVTPPTCEGEGYTTYKCKNCPHSYVSNRVPNHGHTYGDWFIAENASATSDGHNRRNCVNCNKFETKPLAVIATGNMGKSSTTTPADNVKYTLYEDGTLKLSGSGAAFNCNWNGSNQPYFNLKSQVTRAIICEGITEVGAGTFAKMPNLEYAYIPTTLSAIPNNLYMDSFKKSVTSFTFPANITKIGICAIGPYDQDTAVFTKVIIENPSTTFVESTDNAGNEYTFVNRFASNCKNLTVYSYGASNEVQTYCSKYNLTYVDLSTTVSGTVDNISYNCFNGVLTLNALDTTVTPTLPSSQKWLETVDRSAIKEIVINASISEIPQGYFIDYTGLTKVELPKSLRTIGNEAFATTTACANNLTLTFADGIRSVATDFLKNRSSVTVNGFDGTNLDNGFSQSGVTLNLRKTLKILLIGNSLSMDAADCLSVNQPSQLYDIIRSMVGNEVDVRIGILYNGAKTAGWHATVAESNAKAYQFYYINEDTGGVWKSISSYATNDGLTYDNWDIITIQPYASETKTGIGSTGDTDANPNKTNPVKIEKFYPLSASLPYLLDRINSFLPDAKVYYYLTWSNYYNSSWSSSSNLSLNGGESEYVNKMLPVARTALTYKGTTSGKGFDGLIAGGTAIQNARSTYLGTQFYVTKADPNQAKPDSTSWIGLQRDDVHLSLSTGRYIVGLAFAEMLVPQDMRLPNYTLPDIADTVKGPLPKAHSTLAQLCVQKMLETSTLAGDEQFKITKISGYEIEP